MADQRSSPSTLTLLEDMWKASVAELRKWCSAHTLRTSGCKGEIIARIVAFQESEAKNLKTQPRYFEKQRERRWDLHVVNNACGEHVVSDSGMEQAFWGFQAETKVAEAADHIAPDGNYSDAILAYVVRGKGLQLEATHPVRPTQTDIERFGIEGYKGAIVHLDRGHWVGMRRDDENLWLLDSLVAPRLLTMEEAIAYIEVHSMAYNIAATPPPGLDGTRAGDVCEGNEVQCLDTCLQVDAQECEDTQQQCQSQLRQEEIDLAIALGPTQTAINDDEVFYGFRHRCICVPL
eukprot:TRINITY_DN54462_c0_g1_i1.p1 TRINITY_DN54462_c0_g1~~TRINITY_DN54462_c0_g1_i1.p1  ORF type:complete len:291 (+),score=47.53 TRINITY_DN54462_c0_g1_i1:29-901(+)